jgi:hypothetical protein
MKLFNGLNCVSYILFLVLQWLNHENYDGMGVTFKRDRLTIFLKEANLLEDWKER